MGFDSGSDLFNGIFAENNLEREDGLIEKYDGREGETLVLLQKILLIDLTRSDPSTNSFSECERIERPFLFVDEIIQCK